MTKLDQAIADLITLDGLPRVASADDGTSHVLYLDGETVRSMLVKDWPPPLPSDPTPAQSAAAIAAREAARRQFDLDRATRRQKLLSDAQSAVGTAVDQLTAVQLRALVGVLLWMEGGVDTSGRVKPIGEWVR